MYVTLCAFSRNKNKKLTAKKHGVESFKKSHKVVHLILRLHVLATSRRMRWVGNIARMGGTRGVYRVSVGEFEGKNHLENPGVDGRVILRWIFRNGLDWSGSGYGQVSGCCECVNDPWCSIQCGEISWLAENRLASQEGLCSMDAIDQRWATFWARGPSEW